MQTNEISEYLIHEKEFKLGLLGGDLAWCVYLNETECFNEKSYIDRILEKAVNNLNLAQSPISFDIHGGIGSLYITLNFLNKRDVLDSSDFARLEKKTLSVYEFFLEQNNFDFLFGCTGLGVGFIYSGIDLTKVAKQYIDRLWNIYKSSNSIDIYLPKSNVINFGLAHGICSIAMLLMEFISRGVRDVRITDILNCIGNSLVNLLRKRKNDVTVVPISVKANKILSTAEIFGWCTGRLSYGVTLLKIFKETGEVEFERVANQILEDALNIYDPAYIQLKNDNFKEIAEKLCLCHGMSSSCLLFRIVYESTGDERFLKISEGTRNTILHTFNQHKDLISNYKNNLSLLAGLSGVFLSISPNKNNLWRKLILL